MRTEPEIPACITLHPGGVALGLRVVPNASRTEAAGLHEGRLRLRVQAPPVEGKANEAVRKWAARVFGVRASRIEILSGETGRTKTLLIADTDLAAAANALAPLLRDE